MAFEFPKSLDDLPVSKVKWVGKPVNRVEDPQLVTGKTEFIDNVTLPGMLHCAILHSPHAHARIKSIDMSRAAALPGVVTTLTGEDAERWTRPMYTTPQGWGGYVLATDRVRFVGEPVAAVAATSRYIAEDALELIDVEYEPIDPIVDAFAAAQPDSPKVFEDHDDNIMYQRIFTWGEVEEAFQKADHVYKESFRWNRVGANPLETFGIISEWDIVEDSLTCRGSFQTPSFMAMGRAATFRLPSNKVRFIAQPHGGSFGGKGGGRGTDITLMLSRKAGGRPVKWIEDRMEYLSSGGSQAWDRHYDVSIAVKDDGTVTALRVKLLDDMGATAEGFGATGAVKPMASFTGCYAIPAAEYDLTLVATNKLPVSPYRGMGPPPHNFVLEQMMDIAARDLDLDPAEIRRRNFIPADQFPYIIASGNEYDSGEYEAALDKVLEMAGYEDLRREQEEARAEGRLVGIGVVSTIEPGVFDWNAYTVIGTAGIGIPEGVTVAIDTMGKITARVGFALEGQGQYTVITQLLAEYFGTELEDVRVVHVDNLSAPPNFGPGGSRLGVAITGAVLGAAQRLTEKLTKVAAKMFEVQPEDIELLDGMLRVKKVPESQLSVRNVAAIMLNRSDMLPPDVDPSPQATFAWTAPDRVEPDEQGRVKSYLTAANACHLVMVEIDPGTGKVEILKYYIADDCGTRLNPANVEGMIQGALAQGVGAALLEEYVYDDDGQLLTASFMDYLLPTIHEVPFPEKAALVTPSPFTPLGAKGAGESAIHTTPAAIMCAINDALLPLGVRAKEVPASPNRLWKLIQGASDQ
ncbi:MAG: xanthine dehydrogenase family protein molybdopterin-binding subunit [Chloroflexi bacterium]|nr:xanthine dehydrogenase family protein molybdopterin-binding subunit [Chloroflexota bacterium]